ncbi:MAG: Fic family protein [Desulfobacterales bacterium]|nr:Fic family protein [Desulfobacterales bacterium]
MKKNSTFKKIDGLRKRYYNAIDGKQSIIDLINEAEIAENVYNSNAIENSTLTLEETEKILLQIDLDRFVSAREMFEATNLARVMEYIHKKATNTELNTEVILFLHKMLIGNIQDEIAGRFRCDNEFVRVGSHIAPAPKEIAERMKNAIIKYCGNASNHIIQRVAKFHLDFEYTHPFIDGNGRIGRVLNNFLLLKEGYVPVNIQFIDRQLYYDAFNEYDNKGKTDIMDDIIAKALLNSYHKRLAYIEGKKIIKLSEYAKKNKLSHSNLLNKAKRQTIETFLEKGVWKIGAN